MARKGTIFQVILNAQKSPKNQKMRKSAKKRLSSTDTKCWFRRKNGAQSGKKDTTKEQQKKLKNTKKC